MKNLPLLLFLIFSTSTYGQLLDDYHLKKDTASFINSTLITKTKIDSCGIIKNHTTIQQYDDKGFLSYDLTMDDIGKTIVLLSSHRPDQFTAIEYYNEGKLKGDTAYYIYNKEGFLISEKWNWGEDKETEKSTYTYNAQNKLISTSTQYEFGNFYDTLIYQNNKLTTILSYDKAYGLDDSIAYHYNSNGQLYEIRTFDKWKKLTSLEKLMNYQFNKPTYIEDENYYHEKDTHRYITTIKYYPDGKTKYKLVQHFKNEDLLWEAKFFHSNKGFLKEKIHNDYEKKITTRSSTILKDNEKK